MTFDQWNKVRTDNWKTAPISCVCKVLLSANPPVFCDKPTVKAYPTMGGGWMALCARHSLKHKEAFDVVELISKGETFQ